MNIEEAQAKADELARTRGDGAAMTYDQVRIVGDERSGYGVEARLHADHTTFRRVA